MIPVRIQVDEKVYQVKTTRHPRLYAALIGSALLQACSAELNKAAPHGMVLEARLRYAHRQEPYRLHLRVGGTDAPTRLAGRLLQRLNALTDPRKPMAQLLGADLKVQRTPSQVATIVGLKTDKAGYSSGDLAQVEVQILRPDGRPSVIPLELEIPGVSKKQQLRLGVCGGDDLDALARSLSLAEASPQTLADRLHYQLLEKPSSDQLVTMLSGGDKDPVIGGRALTQLPRLWRQAFAPFPSLSSARVWTQPTLYDLDGKAKINLQVSPVTEPTAQALIAGTATKKQTASTRPQRASLGHHAYRTQLFEDDHWLLGEFDGLGLDRGLVPAPKLVPIDRLPGQMVTSLYLAGEELYSGWTGGRVRRHHQGENTTVVDTGAAAVTALGRFQGRLLCGLSTPGRIRWGEAIHELESDYVWAIDTSDPSQALIACGRPARLYRFDGRLKQLWQAPDEHLTSIRKTAEGFLLTTAPEGLVYHLTPGLVPNLQRRRVAGLDLYDSSAELLAGGDRLLGTSLKKGIISLLQELAGGPSGLYRKGRLISKEPITRLAGDGSVSWAGGARLWRIEDPAEGRYLSRVYDTGAISEFGRIRWTEASNSDLKIRVRSGGTPEADDSWSPWSPPLNDSTGTAVPSPQNRYFQFAVELAGGRLSSLDFSYRHRQTEPELQFVSMAGRRLRDRAEVKWSGQVPGSSAELYYQDAKGEWKLWSKAQRRGVHSGSLASFQEGPHRLKLVLKDDQEKKLGEMVSETFFVIKTQPKVSFIDGSTGLATSSPHAQVVTVEYRVGAADPWRSAEPEDGVFDSSHERFTIPEPAGLQIEVRVLDETGSKAFAHHRTK